MSPSTTPTADGDDRTVVDGPRPFDGEDDAPYSATEVHASGANSWTVFIASRASVRLS